MSAGGSVVAIIAAHNEADIIEQVILDLIEQGISVYFLDDASTDETLTLVERHLGHGVTGIERLSPRSGQVSGWERILARKSELASTLDAEWFIHHDADEFRESPWPDVSLSAAITAADGLGFNAIDFAGFDFWPTGSERFRPGDDVRKAFASCAASAAYDRTQIRAWKKTAGVDLISSGGHEARFPDRRVFPLRFILRHYPIRSQAHGERKVAERRERFPESERARGWHVQYDGIREGGSFVRDPATLMRFDPTAVRIDLAARPRGIEALEGTVAELDREVERLRAAVLEESSRLCAVRQELTESNATVAERTRDLEAWRQRAAESQRTADGMRVELHRQLGVRGALERTVREQSRRLDELHASRSWRWMAPARALFRLLGGK